MKRLDSEIASVKATLAALEEKRAALLGHAPQAAAQAAPSEEILGPRNWRGLTAKELKQGEKPDASVTSWSRVGSTELKLRGKGHTAGASKVKVATAPLYECVSADVIRGRDCKVQDVVERLADVPPAVTAEGERSLWTPACPLPRVVCMNVMLPFEKGGYQKGQHPEDDSGCSLVGFFHIRNSTVEMLESGDVPAHVRLFQSFLQNCVGNRLPDGDQDSGGVLKAIARVENPDELNAGMLVRPIIRKFNAKPVLITKSGSFRTDPSGEWVELGVDVRDFNFFARQQLVDQRALIPECKMYIGFLIQAYEEEQQPEQVILDLRIHHLDLIKGGRTLDIPRTG